MTGLILTVREYLTEVIEGVGLGFAANDILEELVLSSGDQTEQVLEYPYKDIGVDTHLMLVLMLIESVGKIIKEKGLKGITFCVYLGERKNEKATAGRSYSNEQS